jgi:hypothetical protein
MAGPGAEPPTRRADNYIETIHSDFEIEINAPYLMYTHGNDEVRARPHSPLPSHATPRPAAQAAKGRPRPLHTPRRSTASGSTRTPT